MIIDALNLFNIVKEIKDRINNSKLVKIQVIDDYTFLFTFLTRTGIQKLVVDLTIGIQSIFIPEKDKKNEKGNIQDSTTHFLRILRNTIVNDFISDIYIKDFDRTIVFRFQNYFMIVEMMGNNYNIIVTDTDFIIKGILKKDYIDKNRKTINESNFFNRNRALKVKSKYIFSQNNKIDPLEEVFNNWNEIRGLSKISLNILEKNSLETSIENLLNKERCVIIYKNGIPKSVFPFIENIKIPDSKEFSSYMEALNYFYFTEKKDIKYKTLLYKRQKEIESVLKNYKKRYLNLEDDSNVIKRMEEYKVYADLLKSNSWNFQDIKTDSIKVINYFSENQEEIDIKVLKNRKISESIDKYYILYKKEKRALEKLNERKKYLQDKIDNLKKQIESLDKMDETELSNLESKKTKSEKRIFGKIKKINFKDNIIFVGGSAEDNDYLLSHIAKGNYTWFHVQNLRGAHVIIDRKFNELTQDQIIKAAQLAAVNSKAKNSNTVPVDYTSVKYVKKIKGVKGKVTFSNNKTVFVKLD